MARFSTSSPARDEARRRLGGKTGRVFWRALDELGDDPGFCEAVAAEFPAAFADVSEVGRRQVLKVMAASLGLAGLTACSDQPDAQALPYVRTPEFMVPDRPRHYATAVTTLGGYAQPVLGTTHLGRPTKLEGLPEHAASLGAADAFTQAAVLSLYDPDRSSAPRLGGQIATWGTFDKAMVDNAARLDARQGEGLRLLTGQQTSPTFGRQWAALKARWPKARWHVLEAVHDDLRGEATRRVFGRPLQSLLRLDRAEVVVCLDDDPLGPGSAQTLNARRWAMRRRAYQEGAGDHRLFVAEPTPTLTGAVAQDRLITEHGRIGLVAAGLAAALGEGTVPAGLTERERGWIAAIVEALGAAPGRGLVSVGAHQQVEVQALGLWIAARLGAVGTTLELIDPVVLTPSDGAGSFEILAADMAAGRVDTLMVLDANPAYAAPADIHFVQALGKVRMTIHAGLHVDETARLCRWHVPIEHDLETWTDARAIDGTVSIVQPLVRPFRDVRSRHALIEAVQGGPNVDGRELVAQTWRATWGQGFEDRWREALRRGFVEGSAVSTVSVLPAGEPAFEPSPPMEGLEVIFRPDPCLWDGRFANNPWLQELPKPLSKVTWDNVLAIAPALARDLGVANGALVRVEAGGRTLEAAAWITPGQARRTVTAFLGYGRRLPEQLGDGHGYDAYALRSSSAPWAVGGARLVKAQGVRLLASTQAHQALEGHDFVRSIAREAALAPAAPRHRAISFYPDKPQEGPAWGLSVDTDLCIGCNACVTACDAENNIAMVGKDQVAKGREMHWLRIDHYFEGDPDAPSDFFQPVPCMHCEQAPCEMGCPVEATVHAPDGLNLQVYNRCIGTRTCSSYCPYKVRRFNWFDFTKNDPPERQAQRNPNVTVRSRGVMEKCTYCIQRISDARIQAKIEGRQIADGEIKTACQQTCPTDAIVFGNIRDSQSAVSRRKASPRDYALLEEANTRPRTTYLARITPTKAEGESG
jgi:molybdopterin-containing oxidoreductase family iron-sulfur binding subunit